MYSFCMHRNRRVKRKTCFLCFMTAHTPCVFQSTHVAKQEMLSHKGKCPRTKAIFHVLYGYKEDNLLFRKTACFFQARTLSTGNTRNISHVFSMQEKHRIRIVCCHAKKQYMLWYTTYETLYDTINAFFVKAINASFVSTINERFSLSMQSTLPLLAQSMLPLSRQSTNAFLC